jgi:shikimate kinase
MNLHYFRRSLLTQRPLCDVCKSEGAECNHFDNETSNNYRDSPIGLCNLHNSIKIRLFQNARRYWQLSMPFFLPRPCIPVTVVCGRPGSGKSTYVAKLAAPTDQVIDLDEITASISGLPIYHNSNKTSYAKALNLRNKQLAALSMPTRYTRCWLIASGMTIHERIFWHLKTNGDVVIMKTPLEECLSRIQADPRRPREAKLRQIEAARKWE